MAHRRYPRYMYEYLLAFLIPLGILLVTFLRLGIYPFGDVSVMLYDMPVQYVNYFGWLSDTLRDGGGLGYSLAKGFGGGMASTFAYYLSSPFNLLAIFFDSSHTPELFSVLYLVKIPTAGITCLIFLRGRFADRLAARVDRVRAGIPLVVFACAYALMTYAIGYASNIMWLDGIIMLPLAALGVYRAVSGPRCGLLFVSILMAVLANWYTGYMVCLFTVLYAFYEQSRAGLRPFGRSLWRYAGTMVCALGASMVLMLPNVMALLAGKGSGAGLSNILTLGVYLHPANLLNYACVGTFPGIISVNRTPAIAISASVLLMTLIYFVLPRVEGRQGVRDWRSSLILLLLLGTSLVFAAWANVWTGFKDAPSYMERNSFVISFFMVFLSAEAWLRLLERGGDRSWKRIAWATGALIVAFLLSSLHMRLKKGVWMPSGFDVALEVALLVVYAALIVVLAWPGKDARRRLATAAAVVFMGVFVAEDGYNTGELLGLCNTTVSSYTTYIDRMEGVYASLEEGCPEGSALRVGQAGFYYLGTKWNGTGCESLLYGASTFDHYSSTQESDIQDLLTHLGYMKTAPFGTYYASPLLVPDDLLAVSRIIDDSQPALATKVDGYDLPYEGYSVYGNEDALPLGYGVPSGAGDVEWTDSPFANQELMVGNASGAAGAAKFYTRQRTTEVPTHDGVSRSWTVTVSQDGPLYAYTDRLNTDATNTAGIETDLYLDGKLVQQVGGRTSCNVVYLGTFSEGTTVTITLVPLDPGQAFKDQDHHRITAREVFYEAGPDDLLDIESLDVAAFEELKGRIDADGFRLTSLMDGSLDATFHASQDETLLISIPYDTGWTAWVDGRQVEVSCLYDGLLGIPVSQGDNTIEMRYTVPGLVPGLLVSIVSVAVFCAWRLIARRRREVRV